MQHVALFVLIIATALTVGHTAPTQQEAILEELLAETESEDMNQNLANVEQETLRDLRKFLLNATLNYFKNRFVNPKDMTQRFLGQEDGELAEIEQNTLKELFGTALNGVNNYAQTKLNPKGGEQPMNLRQLIGTFVNGANNFAQRRLQKPRVQYGPLPRQSNHPSQEMATIEQQNLLELGAKYLLDQLGVDTPPEPQLANSQLDRQALLNTGEELKADEQVFSAILPILSSLASRFLSSNQPPRGCSC